MGKKIAANPKAVEAKAKKEEKKQIDTNIKQKAKEDALWIDDDKQVNKKAQRKDDKESKRLQQLDKKKELQSLADKEMDLMVPKKVPVIKMTQYQLDQTKQKAAEVNKAKVNVDESIPENVNRIKSDGKEARNVEDALKMLGLEEKADRHNEKRVKASYLKFEERRLAELKAENPGLRLSQLKQILSKEFDKSAENPKNQDHVMYNFKEQRAVTELNYDSD